MTYIVKATNLSLLEKKVQAVFETLQNFSSDWEYVYYQSVEDVINLASKDLDGNYKATIFFSQVPLMKNNYHGLLKSYEQEAKRNRVV